MSQGSTGNSPWHDDERLAIGKGSSALVNSCQKVGGSTVR